MVENATDAELELLESVEVRSAELSSERKELLRVLRTLIPHLIETECECGDDGLCAKHLVEVTLANPCKN